MTLKTVFDKTECERCGGCGQHSYNPITGSRCFGCEGKGEVLTKRGQKAFSRYIESCSIPAREVVVGDWINMAISTGQAKRKVTEITEGSMVVNGNDYRFLAISSGEGNNRHTLQLNHDTMVRKYWTVEENDQKIADALAYQDTMIKDGTKK